MRAPPAGCCAKCMRSIAPAARQRCSLCAVAETPDPLRAPSTSTCGRRVRPWTVNAGLPNCIRMRTFGARSPCKRVKKVCCGRAFWRDLRAAVRPPTVDAGRPDCDTVDAAVLPVPVVYALRSLTADDSTSEPLSPLSRSAPTPPLAAPGPSAACRERHVKWHKHNQTS